MYKLVRNIHLISSLIILPFLLVYAISSVFFAHHFLDFFSISEPERNAIQFQLNPLPSTPKEISSALSENHGIRGHLQSHSINSQGEMSLTISRTGTQYKVLVDTSSGMVTSKEETASTPGFLAELHNTAGFSNKTPEETWWGASIIIVAILLVFAVVSGFVLWAYRSQERRSGLIFLGASLAYCFCVISVLRFS